MTVRRYLQPNEIRNNALDEWFPSYSLRIDQNQLIF
jgi:hypothetical protein